METKNKNSDIDSDIAFCLIVSGFCMVFICILVSFVSFITGTNHPSQFVSRAIRLETACRYLCADGSLQVIDPDASDSHYKCICSSKKIVPIYKW